MEENQQNSPNNFKEILTLVGSGFAIISALFLGATYFSYYQIEKLYFEFTRVPLYFIEFDLYNFLNIFDKFIGIFHPFLEVLLLNLVIINICKTKTFQILTNIILLLCFASTSFYECATYYHLGSSSYYNCASNLKYIDVYDISRIGAGLFSIFLIFCIIRNKCSLFSRKDIIRIFWSGACILSITFIIIIRFSFRDSIPKPETVQFFNTDGNTYYLDANFNFCKLVRKYNNKIICTVLSKYNYTQTNIVLLNSDNIAQVSFEQIDPSKSEDIISAIKIVRSKSAKPDLNNEAFNLYYRNTCSPEQKVELPKKHILVPKEDSNLSFVNSIIPKIKTEDNLYLIDRGDNKYLINLDENTKAQINKQIEQYKQAGCKEAQDL